MSRANGYGFYSNLSAAAFWTINLSKSRTLNLLINKEKKEKRWIARSFFWR
ncbi:hypothetical protein [uncultured Campylobacter sp.]|uniref:hypothetical protein n=1 Tax=uncultured Campylobacter sp. TaxID=218934 RepID=UPI003211C2F0